MDTIEKVTFVPYNVVSFNLRVSNIVKIVNLTHKLS